MSKDKQYRRNLQKKVMVSEHDLRLIGGDDAMNQLLRGARDKAVREACGCEACECGLKQSR